MTVRGTGMGGMGRAGKLWRLLWAFPFCLQAAAIERDTAVQSPTVAEARQHLKSAAAAADNKDAAGAQALVLAVIYNPVFESLDEPTRHAALALAAQLALQSGSVEQAQQFAVRASQSTEQSVDDWRNRLSASMKAGDAGDEAECLAVLARRWGRDSATLPDGTVRQVVRDTARIDSEARIDLLEALYELRWRPADGGKVGAWWVELCRLLLAQNRTQDAIQIAAIVSDPRDIIAFRADRQFRPLLKSNFVKSNARRAALDEIAALRLTVRERPRSLRALQLLIGALINSRFDAEALALSEDATRRIDAAEGAPAPFEDVERLGSILDHRSRALRHLARFDEAVQQLQRGAQLPHRRDKVSQPIDLALLLCELDRPGEALAALPQDDKASDYGKMLITLVRLTAALEQGRAADAATALSYLREHRLDSPSVLLDGLLRADMVDEAERELLSRLHDPAERTSALIEAQDYFEWKRPPREAQWHDRYIALKARPAVGLTISQLGEIGHYPWTYGFN
jgi:hypothetical protein